MKITEVNIQLIRPRDSLIGFASCVIDGQLFVSNISIHRQLGGKSRFRLLYPAKKIAGEYIFYFNPIERELGEEIHNKITERLEELEVSKNLKL